MNVEKETTSKRCAECGRGIQLGEDALAVEQVVIGPRFPVPVGEMQFFHVNSCFERYVCNSDGERLPKRVP